MQRYLLPILLLQFLLTVYPRGSGAATFIVNSIHDINDLDPGNGLCVAYILVFPPYVLPFCTLRGAVEETNALPGPDLIILPAGTYSLSRTGPGEDNSLTGDLDITSSLIIMGAGTNNTFVDAAGIDRVIDLSGRDSKVIIRNAAIINGSLDVDAGTSREGGAGIRNSAMLSLENVLLSTNGTTAAMVHNTGGGIMNKAVCSIRNSTIEKNSAWIGGGIMNEDAGTLEVENTTISENSARSGAGLTNDGSASLVNVTISGNRAFPDGSSTGGAVQNRKEIRIIQSTIARNQAGQNGSGIHNEGICSIINTIVAENLNSNCNRPAGISSSGFNLEDTDTCGMDQNTDLVNTDPGLTSLDNHGGPTKTHALFIGSPAVDNGKNLLAEGVATDQRGVKRPLGRAYDIGAFETKKRSIGPLLFPLLSNTDH